ncbi:MAG TPA: hypothetical protein VHY82_00575 [Acetobacteraceae bacterium]|nr:hypothetical protein [Acetobacteraceae bacterium]
MTIVIALLGTWYGAAAQVATTTIQDTVYRADGTPASGTVVVSWPTFTTAAGKAVASGNTSAAIGPNGALSLTLAPNAGAIPTGSYYTAVLHLDDGTTSQQYWVVPVSATPVTLAAIENQVLPASVAMQTASRAYVDAKIAQVTGTSTTGTTTYVPTTGGTMTGPLVLPGDPVTPTQAADKHYVDTNVTALGAGVGQKVSMVPTVTQTVAQPAGTQLQVNALNGELYASQFQTGDGGNGIANALAGCGTGSGCLVKIDPSYTASEPVATTGIPNNGHLIDQRQGADIETFVNPVNGAGSSTAESLNQISTNTDANSPVAGSGVGSTRTTLYVSNTAMAGGSNQLPGNIENAPYGKANYAVAQQTGNFYTAGQHVQDQHVTNCYAVGDCLEGSWVLTSSGGYRDMADEGAHPFDLQVNEDWHVFQGTCTTGCTTGSTQVTVNATIGAGTQGEGRFLIDKNPAKTISVGQLVSSGQTIFPIGNFTGTNFPVSVFVQTAAAATSQPKNIAPGTVTLPISTTTSLGGFSQNTNQLPATGVACVADINDGRFPNFEMANYTVVDATHITLTLNKVHASGAVIAVGGLCGYGIEQTVDTIGYVRQLFPVVGSPNSTAVFYAGASTGVLAYSGSGSTSGYQNISLTVTSIARHANVVTVTLPGNPVDVTGLTMTVSGVSDASYNGSFQMSLTGPNQVSYTDPGPDSTSSGGTITFLTGGYVLYPMAEVLSVYDSSAKSVDGQLTLSPNMVAWAPGDAVEEPHYYQQLTAADTEIIGQYVPRPVQYSSAGKDYLGEVGPGMRGWEVQNGVSPSNYLGDGGTHSLPDDAYVVSGPWTRDFEVDAGTESIIRAHCNLRGCNRWNSGYSLFLLDSVTGTDSLYYAPNVSSVVWTLGGQQYTFSPAAFTAKAVNTTTLTAAGAISGTTVTGKLSSGSGAAGVFTTNNHTSDAVQVESQDVTGYSSIGMMDNTGVQAGSFGYANPSAQSAFAGAVFFNSDNHAMKFSTNNGVSPSLSIDAAGNITFPASAGVSNSGVMSAKQVSAPVLRSGTAANTDVVGTLTVSAGATSSASYSFTGGYGSAPVCIVQPQSATPATVAAVGAVVPQVSTTTLSVSVQTAPAAAITIGYECVGRN